MCIRIRRSSIVWPDSNRHTYLKVLVGKSGTGPVRLLKDKSLGTEQTPTSRIESRIDEFDLKRKRNQSSSKQKNSAVVWNRGRKPMAWTRRVRALRTYRKESCGILASDAGNGPDKLLLFSLLRQEQKQTRQRAAAWAAGRDDNNYSSYLIMGFWFPESWDKARLTGIGGWWRGPACPARGRRSGCWRGPASAAAAARPAPAAAAPWCCCSAAAWNEWQNGQHRRQHRQHGSRWVMDGRRDKFEALGDCLHLLQMGEVGDPPGQSPRQALARHSPETRPAVWCG